MNYLCFSSIHTSNILQYLIKIIIKSCQHCTRTSQMDKQKQHWSKTNHKASKRKVQQRTKQTSSKDQIERVSKCSDRNCHITTQMTEMFLINNVNLLLWVYHKLPYVTAPSYKNNYPPPCQITSGKKPSDQRRLQCKSINDINNFSLLYSCLYVITKFYIIFRDIFKLVFWDILLHLTSYCIVWSVQKPFEQRKFTVFQ